MYLPALSSITLAILLSAVNPVAPASKSVAATKDSITAQDIVKKTIKIYEGLSSYSSIGETTSKIGTQIIITTFSIRLQRPSQYRVEWKNENPSGIQEGSVWSDRNGDWLNLLGTTQKMKDRKMALAAATGVSGNAAATIPAVFFKEDWGNVLNPNAAIERMPDEKVDNVDCYVILSTVNSASRGKVQTLIWLGHEDGLIHQTKTVVERVAIQDITDEQIKDSLKKRGKTVSPASIAATRTAMDNALKSARDAARSGKIEFIQCQRNILINKVWSSSDFSNEDKYGKHE